MIPRKAKRATILKAIARTQIEAEDAWEAWGVGPGFKLPRAAHGCDSGFNKREETLAAGRRLAQLRSLL
jgi:hypothetical protein